MEINALIKHYKKKLESIISEVRDLDLKNDEDSKLCKNLYVKIECYTTFIRDLENLLLEKAS